MVNRPFLFMFICFSTFCKFWCTQWYTNFIDGERTFTVWSRANRFLPGIEFHTGISDSLADAVHQLK